MEFVAASFFQVVKFRFYIGKGSGVRSLTMFPYEFNGKLHLD